MRYKKNIIVILVFLLIFIIAQFWRTYHINSIHSKITISDVESIKTWGETGNRIVSEDEMKNIITWFNSMKDIRENPDFQGTTEDSGIIIMLKSKKQIDIARSGEDFEVQRFNSNGMWISYWGKQPDIKKILDASAGK